MTEALSAALSGIRTVEDMVGAFADEERCRRLVEAMVWPTGRVCPACGYRHSVALAGRDMGKFRARPGLYQCSNGACRFQFTVTTRTPLHSTKLPLGTWLKAMWLILQSDKGLSSVRLAEALGVSQPTGLADGTRVASHGGARESPRRHGRDRRVLYRRPTEEKYRRAATRSWSQGPAQDPENARADGRTETQRRCDRGAGR